MKISIVTSMPWLSGPKTHAEVFREGVEQVVHAEQLGFDCAWFTEHHFGKHGINSSVLSYIAYVAGVTRHIHLGPAVVVAPLYQPVRLAEDAATVDILSGGRLEFGIGSGYRLDEFRGLNVRPEESRAMFHEIVEVLLKAWSGEPFSHRGKYYTVDDGIAVRPVPLQKPHPPIWVPAISPSTIDYVARNGFHAMAATTGNSFAEVCAMSENYRATLAAAGRHPDSAEFYVHSPVHFVEASYGEMERTLTPLIKRFTDAAVSGGTIYHKEGRGNIGPLSPPSFDFRDYYEHHGVLGSPEYCLDKLADFWEKARFTHLTCAFSLGIPHVTVMKQMEQFARYLMPTLRELDKRGPQQPARAQAARALA